MAQSPNALSLNDAIQTALANRYDLKVQQTNVRIAENEVKKVNARNMPQITSDLDVRYNSQLQTNILPGNFFGNIPNAQDRPVQFGTKYNTMLGFNLNQTIFNPGNLGDKNIAEAQTQYNALSEKKTENDIKQEVTEAYFTALLWNEKMKLSAANLERTNTIYHTAQDQFAQGLITSYDTKHYQLDYENAYAENEKNKNNFNLGVSDLWYKMGADSVKTYRLGEDINSLFMQYQSINTSNAEIKRPELEMEKQQQDIYRLNIKKQNLSYIPTISFYANYTFQYLNNDFKPLTSTYWYPYNYLGVKASIPIFDGLQKEKLKTEYKLRTESSKLNYEKIKRDFNQDTRTANTSLQNAKLDLEYQKKNLELVNELYSIDTDKLKNGSIKPNDLTTTYYTMQQTQNKYLNAVYNYLMAVVKYKKAVGSL
jgi:outer membrane protein TolC